MKKRILTSSIIIVLFALIIVTSSFIAMLNIKEIDKTKEILSIYNNIVIHSNLYDTNKMDYFKINKSKVRFTIIDKQGNVIFDNEEKNLENHLGREEVLGAFKYGEASSIRFSKTKESNLVYYATKIDENTVIRSSVSLSTIEVFTVGYVKYYITIIILVLLLSLVLSKKLIRAIIYPVKELEIATTKIANGDYSRRVDIHTNDEIGSLAHTFNNMADQLQLRINDSLDKQNKLEAILESMESGVIAIDNKESIILINPYAKKVFGITKDIIGENIGNYIIDYDIIKFVRDMPSIETREVKLLHPSNRDLRIKKAPLINNNKLQIGIVIAVQDITDIKRLENMRSQFVANVSHELKTPLTSIKGFAETLKFVNDNDTRNKFLDIIDKEVERLTRLINDILILSNIENSCKMISEEFNPEESIEDVINMVTPQANNKGAKIEFINKNKYSLVGDKDKFLQLILNLVENAIKYSNNENRIIIRLYNAKECTYIEIEDNGIGIPKEDLPRIFERFYRVDKSRAKGGTGLGLAIVKHIVKMFNGDIYVKSTLGVGTKFTVKIKRDVFL